MDKDQIALFLNDHPEFFNEYPELLRKIRSLDCDSPEPRGKTLSLADRLIHKAQEDREEARHQLEVFLEVTQTNEHILNHLYEISHRLFACLRFDELIREFRAEIQRRFQVPGITVCLVEGDDHFGEPVTPERGAALGAGFRVVPQDLCDTRFPDGPAPVLKAHLETGSEWFPDQAEQALCSEALIPIRVSGRIAGLIALGSSNPGHFHPNLRTDYLERLADNLGLAIGNVLLLERLRSETSTDNILPYDWFEPVLRRRFSLALRRGEPLSAVKMVIDYFRNSTDTWEKSPQQTWRAEIAGILVENLPKQSFVFEGEHGEWWMVLPDTAEPDAQSIATQLQNAVESGANREGEHRARVTLGVAGIPDRSVDHPSQLKNTVHAACEQARERRRGNVSV